jgi:hypothetical protein
MTIFSSPNVVEEKVAQEIFGCSLSSGALTTPAKPASRRLTAFPLHTLDKSCSEVYYNIR